MVMAQSLFKTLKQQHPGAAIDVIAPAWSEALLARMPEVNRSITLPVGHGQFKPGVRYRLARSLRANNYQQAIVLPNSFKSALIPFWAHIPKRTGYTGELRWGLLNDRRRLDKTALPMMVQRFVALGLPADVPLADVLSPALIVSGDNVEAALTRHDLQRPDSPVLAICPGAEYGPAKRWPVHYFAEVARNRRAAGWQVWLFGSQNDVPITQEIARLLEGQCVDLAGQTTLADAIDLMSLAERVVTNDSGLMHIAASLDRKLIALYGSSDPGFTPPLNKQATVLSLGLDCSPCFKRDCPLGHMKCLRDLTPDKVIAVFDG